MKDGIYPGLDKDPKGAMNPTGNIIRDARVFGLISDDETCEGWTRQRLEALYDQVTQAWEPYGHLASRLPEKLRARHERIYAEAIRQAREKGWDPERLLDDDN